MAFAIIANKNPLLDLGSELPLEKPFGMAFWRCAPEVLICSFLIYANQTNPWQQRAGTFISVMPQNDCLGESVSLEKLEESPF